MEENKIEMPSEDEYLEFGDTQAMLKHILGCKDRPSRIVKVPEWKTKILCQALDGNARVQMQLQAYDPVRKITDWRKAYKHIVVEGCYNPVNGDKVFAAGHRDILMAEHNGAIIERLALTILDLSTAMVDDVKKSSEPSQDSTNSDGSVSNLGTLTSLT